jgi:hypothetical protein
LPVQQNLSVPSTVYGFVESGAGCSASGGGAAVDVTVTHNGITTLPMGTITDARNGSWSLAIGVAVNSDGSIVHLSTGDVIHVSAVGAAGNVAAEDVIYNPPRDAPQQLNNLCLPQEITSDGSTIQLAFQPGTARPGTSIQATGSLFTPDVPVDLDLQVPLLSGGTQAVEAQATANAYGAYTAALSIPWNAAAGGVNATAVQPQSDGSTVRAGTILPITPASTSSGFLEVAAPSEAPAGETVPVLVTAYNELGAVDTSYTGTVHLGSSDPSASLPADYTFTPADHGVHLFSATLGRVGQQEFQAADINGTLSGAAAIGVGSPVEAGWNLLDVPLAGSGVASAANLAAALDSPFELGVSGVQAVATYGRGSYSIYVPGYSADIPIGPGQGVYVLSRSAAPWVPSGTPYRSAPQVAIVPGWNLVAAPYPAAGMSADAAVREIDAVESHGGSVVAVGTFAGGAYHVYLPGQRSPMTIPASGAVWIESTGTAVWQPR